MKITCKIEYKDGHERNISYEVESGKVVFVDTDDDTLFELVKTALILKTTSADLARRAYELDFLRNVGVADELRSDEVS